MSRRNKKMRRRGIGENPDLDITTFMNLMVILVPFLLISAVFSRITIMELSVPTASAGGKEAAKPFYTIEVVVRKAGIELSNGASVVAAFPKKDEQYDLEKLTEILLRLKKSYPDKEDVNVLVEPDIEYDTLIQIMDRVRETRVEDENGGEPQKLVLFPQISIGDAP